MRSFIEIIRSRMKEQDKTGIIRGTQSVVHTHTHRIDSCEPFNQSESGCIHNLPSDSVPNHSEKNVTTIQIRLKSTRHRSSLPCAQYKHDW